MKHLILIAMVFAHSWSMSQAKMGTPTINFGNYATSIGLFGGLYLGNEIFGEVGIGVAEQDEQGNLEFRGAGVSMEFNPGDDVYGAKLDAWYTLPILPLNVGLGTVSYFQEGRFNQTLRPTIGLSYYYFRFSYGYDFLLGRQNIQNLNRHQLFVRYYLPLKKRYGYSAYFIEEE